MAASTITRDTWTNDSGTTSAPVGDGTILNNSVLQNHIYARIDAMFAGAGAYTTFELGGLLKVDGFGTHTFSAGGTGSNSIAVRNTTAGTGNGANVSIGNDSSATLLLIQSLSSTFTPSGVYTASSGSITANGAGGLAIVSSDGSGSIRFSAGGSTEQMRLTTNGGVGIGTTTNVNSGKLTAANGVDVGEAGGGSNWSRHLGTSFTVLTSASATVNQLDATGLLFTTWPTTVSAANAVLLNGDYLRIVTSLKANKHDIITISASEAVAAVQALRPVLYRSAVDEDQRQWPGFIAEEVAAVAPHLAVYGPDGALQSVAYDRVPAYLVAAVQALTARVSALEAA